MMCTTTTPAARSLRAAGAFYLIACVCTSSAYPLSDDYAFIRLEAVEDVSIGYGVNNHAEVSGAYGTMGHFEPAVWRRGQYRMLGWQGGLDAVAWDVSDAGVVVGFYEIEGRYDVPFVWWSHNKGMIPLPYLDGYDDGRANAVNNAGTIVGINRVYGVGTSRAVKWANGNVWELPNWGMWGGEAKDINEDGWIVGWLIDQDERWQPVLWQEGVITGLGVLWEYGLRGEATAVNDVGQITGFSDARGGKHAFLWEDGEMSDIHSPPDYHWIHSYGRAINNGSVIVGALFRENFEETAFIWRPGERMVELASFLPPKSHWTKIEVAEDINDFGQVVGAGRREDASMYAHGFLMTPVYPTFILDQPTPGIAGEVSTITARNLTRGAKVYFAYSMAGGGAIIPKCEIVEAALQIDDPMIAGTAIANANGVARLTGKVPSKWSGQEVLIQALVPSQCDISNLIVVAFE